MGGAIGVTVDVGGEAGVTIVVSVVGDGCDLSVGASWAAGIGDAGLVEAVGTSVIGLGEVLAQAEVKIVTNASTSKYLFIVVSLL